MVSRRKSDPAKLRLAVRVRTETTLAIKAIARRIHLGSSKCADVWLHEWMKASAEPARMPDWPR